jgi:hypothetical protein
MVPAAHGQKQQWILRFFQTSFFGGVMLQLPPVVRRPAHTTPCIISAMQFHSRAVPAPCWKVNNKVKPVYALFVLLSCGVG